MSFLQQPWLNPSTRSEVVDWKKCVGEMTWASADFKMWWIRRLKQHSEPLSRCRPVPLRRSQVSSENSLGHEWIPLSPLPLVPPVSPRVEPVSSGFSRSVLNCESVSMENGAVTRTRIHDRGLPSPWNFVSRYAHFTCSFSDQSPTNMSYTIKNFSPRLQQNENDREWEAIDAAWQEITCTWLGEFAPFHCHCGHIQRSCFFLDPHAHRVRSHIDDEDDDLGPWDCALPHMFPHAGLDDSSHAIKRRCLSWLCSSMDQGWRWSSAALF